MLDEAQRLGGRVDEAHSRTPCRGDRIELSMPRLGVRPRGTVQYVDDLQILVKWDDGRSESLRGNVAERFRILYADRV